MDKLTTAARTGDQQTNNALMRQRVKINELVALANSSVVGSGVAQITVGATAPSNPQVGDLWIDINS